MTPALLSAKTPAPETNGLEDDSDGDVSDLTGVQFSDTSGSGKLKQIIKNKKTNHGAVEYRQSVPEARLPRDEDFLCPPDGFGGLMIPGLPKATSTGSKKKLTKGRKELEIGGDRVGDADESSHDDEGVSEDDEDDNTNEESSDDDDKDGSSNEESSDEDDGEKVTNNKIPNIDGLTKQVLIVVLCTGFFI